MGEPRTAVELLEQTVERHADRDAYIDGDRRWTYGQWDREADDLAAVLADRGVRAGDLVCAKLPSSGRYAVLYQATMRLGAILSGINPRLGDRESRHIVERSEPRLIVVDDTTPPVGTNVVVTWSELQSDVVPGARLPRAAERFRAGIDTPVAVVWTSGTTGLPKGALFRHAQLRATAAGMREFLRLHDRQITPYPMSQIGYATRVWGEIEHAVAHVITPPLWDPGEALRLIEDESVTIGQGVVTHWVRMLRDPSIGRRDFAAMRLAVIGGFAFAPELAAQIRDVFGCDLVNRYGSTEASGISSTRIGDPDTAVARTVGRACAGVDIEIRDASGHAVPAGSAATGLVWCRSDALMDGYWRDEEQTSDKLAADGWLNTGDVGTFDPDGRLVIKGRSNDSYIRGGFTIHPGEIEGVLDEHPSIRRAAVVSMPDAELGELGVVFVEADRGSEPALGEIRAWVAERLARYKAPDRAVALATLPTNELGKIDKPRLRSAIARALANGVADGVAVDPGAFPAAVRAALDDITAATNPRPTTPQENDA